ncbi:MAG TPA: EAL domain-containing protein [Mycobacteriales bacterium]|nr:EAL domain-containing protein [Mycobacteriales bacterium]
MTERPPHVLVVEDAPSDRALIRAMLERANPPATTSEAHDLRAALARLADPGIDCVVLDLHLPDSDGLLGLGRLVAAAPETAVIVLTGTDDADLALAAVGAGAQDYLLKGRIDIETLARTVRHAIERQQIQSTLAISENRFRRAFEDAPIGMALSEFEADGSRRIVAVNHALGEILLCPTPELVGTALADRIHAEDLERAVNAFTHDRHAPSPPASVEVRLRRCDDEHVWVKMTVSVIRDKSGFARQTLIQVEDITERRMAQQQLAEYSFVDVLTGLPNRLLALDRVRLALARAARTGRSVAVMYVDVDNFKVVNDSLGHAAGDDLLRVIGARLPDAVRPEDTVARIGGDEFVICCDDLPREHAAAEVEAVAIADRVRQQLERSVNVSGHELSITVSVGIAISSEQPRTADELLRDADTALYRAKDNGRSRWELFDDALRAEAVDRLETERALRRALERVELSVLYQPLVAIPSTEVVGAEALLRWRHPSGALATPDDFIRVAEETGLIVPIGRWVLEQAFETLARWSETGRDRTMAVNISAKQLLRSDLAATVAELCAQHALKPQCLTLEVTERQLVDLVGSGLSELRNLADLGVQIALDDFGTGYGSLTYLRTLPVSTVKIDRTFVSGILTSPTDTAIVESVIRLGTTLGLDIVAEGIEEQPVADRLIDLRCPHAQGWLYGHPVSADRLLAGAPG